MKIENIIIKLSETDIPAIKIISSEEFPNVIVIHGYGGNKEEQLGLSWRISNLGYNTYTVDLRGHGANAIPLSLKIQEDIENLLIKISKPSKPSIVVGHSLGGRLALLSKANYRIGISPALSQSYSEQTKTIINSLRQYRVNEQRINVNFEILETLPIVDTGLSNNDLIIYGSRDVPEIAGYCENLSKSFQNVVKVENALHSDIFLLDKTISIIENHLKKLS